MNASDLPDETLFEGALKCRTAAERAAYLDQACAAQPELRRNLEALLQAHDQSGEFLETAVFAARPTIKLDLAPEESSGTVIGRYKLLQKIGEGGMGVVYMAEQTEPVVRKVALKIIKLGMDTKAVVARFEAERQALALMDHPNIAKVLDAGTTEADESEIRNPKSEIPIGRPYFVMELVHGVPITEYCDKNKLSTQQRLELFIPVCQAIQHAHQKGIIHRDIKPSNVMVTLHDGVPVPKVIDFGVAKATNQRLTEKTLFTHYAQLIGTPAYMSPEQAEMSGLDIDTRSDIYSLGVLLYELLTGTTPFDAKELLSKGYAEMQRIIVEQEPVKPSTRMSTLTEEQRTVVTTHRNTDASALRKVLQGDLDWIVMKCLEKDRTRRYETSNGLAADLCRHLNNEPITARAPTTGYLLKKLIKRNKLAFSAAAGVLSAIVLALAAFIYATIHVTRERNEKDSALRERGVAMELAARRAGEVQEQLFESLRSQARAHRYSRRVGQRLESLAALAQAAKIRSDDQLRDEAIAALALPDLRRGPTSDRWVSEGRIFSFDGNYQRYARLETGGEISVCAVSDDRVLQRLASDPGILVRQLKLSPDGEFAAKLEANGRLRVWRVSDGQPVLRETPADCVEMAFSHNSRQLAVGQGLKIRRFDLETGEELSGWTVAQEVYRLAFDPQDRRLAVGYYSSGVVSILPLGEARPAVELRVGRLVRQIVAWHPDGDHLAVAGDLPRIQIWNVSAKVQIARLTGHVQDVTDLSFHPDGGLLASYSWDGTLRLWEIWSGRELLQAPMQICIRFSEDGRWVGLGWSGEKKFHLWEVTPSVEYRTLNTPLAMDLIGVYEGSISPDGRWLALATQPEVLVFDLAAGGISARLPNFPGQNAIFEPSGQGLWTCGAGMVRHWPFAAVATDRYRLGPPRTVPLPFNHPLRISLAAQGRQLAVVSEDEGLATIVGLTAGFPAGPVVEHNAAGFLAQSADGRWLATSGWHSELVRLWEAHTGRKVREWTGQLRPRLVFSPDNQHLWICSADKFTAWNVETGKPGQELASELPLYGNAVAFSPDGRLMARMAAPGIVEISEVTSGRVAARLEDPFGDRAGWMAFTPDNRELVVTSAYGRVVHIWQLEAIRRRLAALGLSGSWPGFAPVGAVPPPGIAAKKRGAVIEVLEASPATNGVKAAVPPNENR